jgi:4-carboxymuconolactone decarboxylase
MSTAPAETPVLDLLATMTAASVEQSELDPRSLMLVRLAALAAVDAPPVSYLMNLAVAGDVGVGAKDVEQVLIGIAPVVGTARVASAGGKIARALGIAIAVAEAELEAAELEAEEAAADDY